MELEVGSILEGKVTGITKFGAFVTFPTGKSGLVHISEIAYPYVEKVTDHLQEGQTVKVKVIGIDQNGRINLSIKRATEQPRPQFNRPPMQRPQGAPPRRAPAAPAAPQTPEAAFEDKLKRFMQDSDSKISGVRQYERRSSRRRGGGGGHDYDY